MPRLHPVIFAAVMLAACAPITKHATFTKEQIRQEALYQQRLAIQQELSQRQRLATVLFKLEEAAASDCNGGKPLSGIELGGIGLFEKPYYDAAQSLDFGKGVRILSVAAGSPADKAGIQAGDTLVAINRDRIHESKTAYRKADRKLSEALQSGRTELSLTRKGSPYTAELRPVAGCPTRILITREVVPSPKANGEAILIPYSLLRLSRTDNELATLASFSLAFNVRDLLGTQDDEGLAVAKNRKVSVLMGGDESTVFLLQKGIVTKHELEEADEYAMTLMRRAGYDTSEAVSFWRRLLVTTPQLDNDKIWGNSLLGPERLVDMRKSIQAMRTK